MASGGVERAGKKEAQMATGHGDDGGPGGESGISKGGWGGGGLTQHCEAQQQQHNREPHPAPTLLPPYTAFATLARELGAHSPAPSCAPPAAPPGRGEGPGKKPSLRLRQLLSVAVSSGLLWMSCPSVRDFFAPWQPQ